MLYYYAEVEEVEEEEEVEVEEVVEEGGGGRATGSGNRSKFLTLLQGGLHTRSPQQTEIPVPEFWVQGVDFFALLLLE